MEPGPLLASGRDGDIFEYGPGLVLRRTRGGRVIEHEARMMEYVAQRGFRVPRVEEVRAGGTEIVMERIDGPLMMDAMMKEPRRLLANVRLLADLHDQLHEIVAPSWLRELDDGDRVLHMDLHPLNVMMATGGPVVIDWGNAARGNPLTDTGTTYVLLTCPDMPGPWMLRTLVQPLRLYVGRVFAARYGPALRSHIAFAAQLKAFDPNMSAREVEACERMARRKTQGKGTKAAR